MTRFESGRPHNTMKIIYLADSKDHDPYIDRLLWRWLNANTGYRGLIVVPTRAKA